MKSIVVLLALALNGPAWAMASHAKNGFFVKLKDGKSVESLKIAGVKSVKSFQLVQKLNFLEVYNPKELEMLMVQLSRNPDVEYVSLNQIRRINSVRVSRNIGDIPYPIEKPANPNKWIKDTKGPTYAASVVEAAKVWEKGIIGDPSMIIADIDTGVDYNHKDLAGNMWHNAGEEGLDEEGRDKRENGVDDDSNGYIDDFIGYDFAQKKNLPYDDHGHGTHTSGVAAAVGGNGIGYSGVCPRCSIMALRFITADGEGTDEDAIRAIEYAVKHGAKVLNCSWGGTENNRALYEAFKAADAAGVVSAVAAGNDGKDISFAPAFPARYGLPNQMTVAALYPTDVFIPFWSNYGNQLVHFSQIGHEVTSTVPGDGYEDMSGTSMATPGIAGTAGLIWSYRPGLTARELKAVMAKDVLADRDSIGKTIYHGRPYIKKIIERLSKQQ
ncbi:MAG: S8 family serine peptidase [Oligoflexia bacterium]|nr:S8 family serine peptidase [Oligoflexia bacterium]